MVNIKQIDKNSKKYYGTHKFLAEELMIPNVNKCDNVRINMFTNHLPQCLVLANPEFPNVFTSFEDQVGKYSVAYDKADRRWKILKKIVKNKMNVCYIIIDKDKNIDIKFSTPSERITERYGYKYKDCLGKKETGDYIEKGEYFKESTTYDEDHHFCYGVNLKALYLAFDNMTYEDAIVISKSAAEKLTAYSPDEFDVTINKNDILINLYGDDENYKPFPEVGETVGKNRLCCARRRLNYESILFDFNIKNIKSVNYDTDVPFYTNKNAIITDIDVFYNDDLEYFKKYPYYKEIVKYIESTRKYYTTVVKCLEKYINDDKYTCSEDVLYYYDRFSKLIGKDSLFRFDGSNFDNIVLRIKTLSANPLVIGSKLTGRYGNKGCVSAILDDEDMPVNQFGERADMILNPLGVTGRENVAQLYEHELNFNADTCLRQTKDMKKLDDKINHIRKFFEIVDPKDTLEVIDEFLSTATKKDKEEFMKDCYEKGLFIKQLPFFGNIDMKDMIKLYKTFGYHPYEFTYKGQPIESPLIMANLYTVRLKHDPKSKFSARASGDLSINNVPSKSSSYKDHNALFSKTPVRMGEMEFMSLELMKDMDAIIKYIKQTSSNPGERTHFNEELLTRNIFDIDRIGLVGTPSVTSQIIKVYFLAAGLENVDNRTFDKLQNLIIKHEGEQENGKES